MSVDKGKDVGGNVGEDERVDRNVASASNAPVIPRFTITRTLTTALTLSLAPFAPLHGFSYP